MDFSIEQITDAIEEVMFEFQPTFNSTIDISIFLSKVGKKLMNTFKSEELNYDKKYSIIFGIGETVIDYLENNGIITLELACDFRKVIRDSDKYKPMFDSISKFFTADAETRQKLLIDSIKDFVNKL
jgi:hypothetical protein